MRVSNPPDCGAARGASQGLANHLADLLVWQQLAADDKLRSEGHYAGFDWHAQEERLAARCAGLRARVYEHDGVVDGPSRTTGSAGKPRNRG